MCEHRFSVLVLTDNVMIIPNCQVARLTGQGGIKYKHNLSLYLSAYDSVGAIHCVRYSSGQGQYVRSPQGTPFRPIQPPNMNPSRSSPAPPTV